MRSFRSLHPRTKKSPEKALLLREWVVIASVFGFMALLAVVSQLSMIRDRVLLDGAIKSASAPFEVYLCGAVQSPGVYQVEPGTSLKDLLKKCPLSHSADRKKVPFKKVFYSPEAIEIPEK